MDDKLIKSILQDALEEEIPSSEINLWPAVKANLVAGERRLHRQEENMITIKSRRTPRLVLAILMILALLTVVFVTPPGRSLAQSVLQFFMRAENKSFPLPPSQITSGEPDSSAPTAAPPMSLISVAQAEAQAGFDAAELPSVPDGFNYLGARLYGNVISVEYEAQGGGGNLIILQSRERFYPSEWDQVPAEAIIPVKIGELDGEYTQSMFVVYSGETSATWNPEAPVFRLRWVENGTWFEMTKYGDVFPIEYLDQTNLIRLAESLTLKP
jgi:hypothetical protein